MNPISSSSSFKKFIPWLVVLVLVLIFDFVKVFPRTKEWIETQKQLRTLSLEVKETNSDLERIKTVFEADQVRFENEAKDFVLEEAQIFPEAFNAYEVSKILELFSIQHSLLSPTSGLRIERISFSGKGQPVPGENFTISKVTLEFLSTEDTLKRFMKYLQSGSLPKDYIDNPSLDTRDVEYLRSHRLPLAHIESIRVNESSKEQENPIKKITLFVSFFSQK
jgi:hypothetical protein